MIGPRWIWLSAALMIALPLAPVWAAELLVIGSENADIEEGAIVDAQATVRLAPGARLTLIAEDGTSITLEGPYEGPPLEGAARAPAGRTLLRALGALFAAGGGRQGSTKGATRGGPAGGADLGAWLIDTGSQGDACTPNGAPVRLWRAKSERASVLKLTHKGARASADVDWPAGAATLAWPGEVPIEDGADYLVRLKGVLVARTLTLHVVPGNLPSEAHRAAWMAERGCLSQARALLAELR